MFKCPYCDNYYEKATQVGNDLILGGHMSKQHKGLSEIYKIRQLKRHSRKNERDRNSYIKKIIKKN